MQPKIHLIFCSYSNAIQQSSDVKMENYKILGRIGKGAHGLVFKALDLETNRQVALKHIAVSNLRNGIPKNIMREICVLRVLNSKHIVQLIDVTNNDCAVIIVMEYLQCSLAEILKNYETSLSLPQVKSYTKMVLSGLNAMHSNRIMHRDLKPANLLINSDGVLKIADFGLSRIFDKESGRTYSHQVGTRWYRAPELLYGSQSYTPAVDIWAVGCILAEMLDNQPLFPGETDIAQLAIVIATLGTPNEENWPGLEALPDYNKISFTFSSGVAWNEKFPDSPQSAVNLITEMIKYDQAKRLTAEKALIHPFFFEHPLPCVKEELLKPSQVAFDHEWNFKDFDEIVNDMID